MSIPGPAEPAAAIPYVEIVNCCNTSDRSLFNIEGLDYITFEDGVYAYTGAGFTVGVMTFVAGNCYTIVHPGNAGTPYPVISALQFADFNLSSNNVIDGCSECVICPPVLSTKLVFTSCCNSVPVVETLGQLPIGLTQLIIRYTGSLVNGFQNLCYVVTQENSTPEEQAILPPEPLVSSYVILSNNPSSECDDYKVPECPECPDPQCYALVNCDGGVINTWQDLSTYVGQYVTLVGYTGTFFVYENDAECKNAVRSVEIDEIADPCPCLCYEVEGTLSTLLYVNCDNEVIKDATITKFCSTVYPIYKGTPGEFEIIEGELCEDGVCPTVCYTLTNCSTDEVIYSTSQLLAQYFNTGSVVTLLGYEGCWEIGESTATNCDCITVTIEDRGGVSEYTATLITPYNGWNRWNFVIGSDNYYIWNTAVNPSSSWIISKDSSGTIPGQEYANSKAGDCPEGISGGAFGWVISEGVSWTNIETEKCLGPCECPVDVTVIQEFEDCPSCVPYVAYKLQNCEKIYEVQYTTQDLSAYVGLVIRDDCGCWTITEIDYVPPSTTLITVDASFKTCSICLSVIYKLTDCSNPLNIIYTSTDLSEQIGSVIKIKNCDLCFSVAILVDYTDLENVENVIVVEEYETCGDCIDLPCQCSTITNYSTETKRYAYLDCEYNSFEIILESGQTSDRICLLQWSVVNTPPIDCDCVVLNVLGQGEDINGLFYIASYDVNGNPVYTSDLGIFRDWEINFNIETQCWDLSIDLTRVPIASLCDSPDCPIGVFVNDLISSYTYTTTLCSIPTVPSDFVYTDHIQYFGNCQHGVCPPPVFKNNRTVRPGYNTPICTPAKYDEITCNFADIMYKIVLEKRYGITNCCPDEDDRWLIQKELIDLQALKDPNYNCPSCPCSCNSGKTYSTCNCGN
jgi:hypothetical protein